MKTAYKLMHRDLTTYNGYSWVMGEWRETSGEGDLCGPGWLHGYDTPTIAAFHNPIHANFPLEKAVLVRMDCQGNYKADLGLKSGWTEMCPVEQVPLVIPTTEQRVCYGIYCAVWVYRDADFIRWARIWLSGTDRSESAAAAAEAAAAWAAAWAAASAAAWAAAKAAWAARAASAAAWAAAKAAWAAGAASAAAEAASASETPIPFEEFALAAIAGTIPDSLRSILGEAAEVAG